MWLKEKMRNDMKFTEIKKKFFDYFREKENGAMSINTKETTQRALKRQKQRQRVLKNLKQRPSVR